MKNWKTIYSDRLRCKFIGTYGQTKEKSCSYDYWHNEGWLSFCTSEGSCPLKVKKKVKGISKPNKVWYVEFPLTNNSCKHRLNLFFIKICLLNKKLSEKICRKQNCKLNKGEK